MSVISSEWPHHFDFGSDETCQQVFKIFIRAELENLRSYDDLRPSDKTYIFHQHAARVARDVQKTALHLGLGDRVAENLYWATLPHDIGKRLMPTDVWDSDEKPTGQVKKLPRLHTLLGVQIVNEMFPNVHHPFKDLMIDIMANHHEQMDGMGTLGITGDKLSMPVRLAAIVEAYDGYRIWRPHFGDRDLSPPAVLKRMREEKGAEIYDMALFQAFEDMKMKEFESLNS
jgi:HD-GYP domain-containing protein (c-di-GMP phosphodiesterase class II)